MIPLGGPFTHVAMLQSEGLSQRDFVYFLPGIYFIRRVAWALLAGQHFRALPLASVEYKTLRNDDNENWRRNGLLW